MQQLRTRFHRSAHSVYFTRTMSIVTCSIRYVNYTPYSAHKECCVMECPSRFGIVAQGHESPHELSGTGASDKDHLSLPAVSWIHVLRRLLRRHTSAGTVACLPIKNNSHPPALRPAVLSCVLSWSTTVNIGLVLRTKIGLKKLNRAGRRSWFSP